VAEKAGIDLPLLARRLAAVAGGHPAGPVPDAGGGAVAAGRPDASGARGDAP
jgi:hypothetical protein